MGKESDTRSEINITIKAELSKSTKYRLDSSAYIKTSLKNLL